MYSFTPHVAQITAARDTLLWSANHLGSVPAEEAEDLRDCILQRADALELDEEPALHLHIALSVLCDLRAHNWAIAVEYDDVRVGHPDRTGMNPRDHKRHVRESLRIERDAQLRESATRRFISTMERRRRHGQGFRSIFSLIRDGEELARALRRVQKVPRGQARTEALREVIAPYVQVVEPGRACEHTGLDLQDVWRYFRHTWVTPYRSVPGRQISFLIRDAAAEHHPIIGIGSLSSSVVQQKQRDSWIGWHPSTFLESLEADGYVGWSGWVRKCLEELLSEIYMEDFLTEGILTEADVRDPSAEVVERLKKLAKKEREAHRLYRQEEQHKRAGTSKEVDWQRQTETYLFRAKRAGRLSDLLRTRRDLLQAGFTKSSPARLRDAMQMKEGRRAIRTVLRFVKAAHVGIDMMDISVCGAVQPYRPILGGKLVSLLLAGPDVVDAYAERYKDASSIIASSMAGRVVNRNPRLVLLMTTSLYSIASSQYNRLKIRPDQHGGEETLEYLNLAHTAGFGSYHFSKPTMDAMEILLARTEGGREVNSIFGEGVNPKFRKVRTALTAVGLPSDHLLKHGSKRIVYAVPLASNFREILIGRARKPDYILPADGTGTQDVIEFWYQRWLGKRIERPDVLERVAEHSTAYPVDHGARVELPPLEEESRAPLFD